MGDVRKIALLYSVGINVFILSLCLFFGELKFGALDDYFMARILEGVYNDTYNVHMVFVNVLYGYILLPLYYLFPKVSWYYVGELFSVFVSLSSIGYISIRKLGLQWGPIFALILSAAYASDYYLVIQFTQCASVLSAAGFLTLIYAMETHSENVEPSKVSFVFPYFMGAVLVIWGAAMRWEAFLMGLPFLCLSLLNQIDWCWHNKTRVLTVLLLLIIVILGIHKLDDLHYRSPDYQAYKTFQPYRVVVGDFDNYDANAVYEDLDEWELSSIDLIRLRGWFFYDKEKFSMEKLKPIVKTIQDYKVQEDFHFLLKCSLAEMARYIHYPISYPWILVCVLLLLCNKKRHGYVWGSLLVCLILMGYLVMISRNVYRVENGFFIYAIAMGVPFLKKISFASKGINLIVLAMLVIGSLTVFCEDASVRDICTGEKKSISKKKDDYQKIWSFIEQSPDSSLFLVSMQSFMALAEQKDKPYISEPFGSWGKVVSLGYWTPYFPAVERILTEKNVQNPIKDVVHDNVYAISNKFDDYLQENYYDSVRVDVVKKFGKIAIDKYSIVELGVRDE